MFMLVYPQALGRDLIVYKKREEKWYNNGINQNVYKIIDAYTSLVELSPCEEPDESEYVILDVSVTGTGYSAGGTQSGDALER